MGDASANIFEQNLDRNEANYQPLTPLSFLQWSESVYPEKTAVIHGDRNYSYREFGERCRRLASALERRGIGPGDTVSVMAPNCPALLEAHYGVPMAGAVLNAINTRLDAASVAFILDHAECKLLIADRELSEVIKPALERLGRQIIVVDNDDPLAEGGILLGETDYETFLREGEPDHPITMPADEWDALSLCYTSGTTGNPKGVVYHHRGAFLNAMGNAMTFGLNAKSVYLWTLPMFHCNGWTYTWGVTAVGGTHVCLRKVDPALIFPMIREHQVTHMCAAPIVLNMLIHAPINVRHTFDHTVEVATGGAAPPSALIQSMESMGFHVTHLYGLTESYGPATVCVWQPEWDGLDMESRARQMAKQGVRYPTLPALMVADPETTHPVPADGETIGEIMLRGHTIMRGYLKNPEATKKAFEGGWYHTGDLAVVHPDGYVEVKDRTKDIIISGGENISSLEVEETLYRHPDVMEAAVVAKPDDKWGETPCAFVTLVPGSKGAVSENEIISFCRDNMAHFKCPTKVVFGPLPKTSTGKIQKYVLREMAKNE